MNALAPFTCLRFMSWLGTNTLTFYMAGRTPLITWAQRSLPTDLFQGVGPGLSSIYPSRAGAWGPPGNTSFCWRTRPTKISESTFRIDATGGSDPQDPTYIASPDTSSYVHNLALLLKNGNAFTGNKGLNSSLHIYLEHGNGGSGGPGSPSPQAAA